MPQQCKTTIALHYNWCAHRCSILIYLMMKGGLADFETPAGALLSITMIIGNNFMLIFGRLLSFFIE